MYSYECKKKKKKYKTIMFILINHLRPWYRQWCIVTDNKSFIKLLMSGCIQNRGNLWPRSNRVKNQPSSKLMSWKGYVLSRSSAFISHEHFIRIVKISVRKFGSLWICHWNDKRPFRSPRGNRVLSLGYSMTGVITVHDRRWATAWYSVQNDARTLVWW